MRTFRARWVFPATSPPIPDGQVSIEGAMIIRVGGADPTYPVDLDLGDAAILPGFVNAHTHLELGPVPWDEASGPEDEVDWLKRVIRARIDAPADAGRANARRHIRLAIEAGTTAIADITTAGQSWDAIVAAPVWATVYAEVLGLSHARSRQTWQGAVDWLNRIIQTPVNWDKTRPGVSPHAPYSTNGWLYWEASESKLPLTTHLGELPAERAWLQSRNGPLRRFVEDLGAWTDDWKPVGPSPINYVLPLPHDGRFGWIIAHGTIFEPPEFLRLIAPPDATGPERVAVASCPRTHARFGHPPHPFRAMLAAGVVVCLGTDSLASAPTLSILDEVRFLHRQCPDVDGPTLLKMATIHGAWAMQLDDSTGSLEAGKSADLVVLRLNTSRTDDPHQLWLDDDRAPLATLFQGKVVAGRLS